MGKICDNRSVGVIIVDAQGRCLVFDRNTPPPGTAPAAGHVDDHGGFDAAARDEVNEELGLTVTALQDTGVGGWRPNACRRQPGPKGTGHEWRVYHATVTGTLNPSKRETRNARWLTGEELYHLALRTATYAHGGISPAEFNRNPGLEPVWVRWFHDLNIVTLNDDDLAAIDRLAAQPPRA